MRIVILLSLLLILLAACTEQVVNTDESSLSEVQLNKKPVKPPQPDPDPLPALLHTKKYIAGSIQDGIVYIWGWDDNDNLTRMWSRSIEGGRIAGVAIANFDGGNKELYVERSITVGKGKKNRIKSHELLIFEEGDTEPSETIVLVTPADAWNAVWDMKIDDVDGDSKKEMVLLRRDQIEIWEYGQSGFDKVAFYDYFSTSEIPWEASVGNLYNDSEIDITVALSPNLWRSYKYDGSSITFGIESFSYTEEFGSLSCAKMVDINNDGTVEVIGGSSCGKLVLWKDLYETSLDFIISPSLGLPEYLSPWGVDVAEIDDDPANGTEIVCGASHSGGLHLFHYDAVNGALIHEAEVVPGLSVSSNGVIISEDDQIIIVAKDNGLEIFDYDFDSLDSDNDTGAFLENLIYQ
ncbi:hypothetical protein ACFLSX_05000 [Calditrichota bacterium]